MTPPLPAFHIQTFGCQMNAGDSDWIARSLLARGFIEAPFADAGLYILNTCSVREKAEQKVYSELGRIARHCKVNRREGVTVCVGGCVAQQTGTRLAARFPEVRLLFGPDGVGGVPAAVDRLVEDARLRLTLLDFTDLYEERDSVWRDDHRDGRARTAPATGFVNIMQGCDNFCTYCIVPYVRGRQKSRSAPAVLDECRSLVAAGAREITLLGQNVNAYGQDKGADGETFGRLLRRVAAIPGLLRLRFVTSHPKDIADEVIAAFAEVPSLCPRLHLPLQSGSDRILSAMNRRYDVARYLAIVSRLKAARPDIVLTTDIIVGFPGESEEDFQATLDLMREVGFASSFSFVYSDRPHTKAALLPGKVERALALDRLSRLQAWQNQASEGVLASLRGEECVILLEGKSRRDALPDRDAPAHPRGERARFGLSPAEESWQGKTAQGFLVNVTIPPVSKGRGGWQGAMLPVRIEAAARHSLKGRQAGAPW